MRMVRHFISLNFFDIGINFLFTYQNTVIQPRFIADGSSQPQKLPFLSFVNDGDDTKRQSEDSSVVMASISSPVNHFRSFSTVCPCIKPNTMTHRTSLAIFPRSGIECRPFASCLIDRDSFPELPVK